MSTLRPNVELLRALPLFEGLTAAEMSEIESVFTLKSYPARTEIIKENANSHVVHILLRGGVRVFVSRPDGMEMLLTILGRGEVLGELSAVDGMPHSAGVTTIEVTDLAWIEGEAFHELLQRMPVLSFNLVKILSHRLRRVTGQAQALATLDASGRVARQILLFGQQYGETLPNGKVMIPIRLKQGDLAGMVGASREKVNRILKYFKTQNYISMTPQSYTVIHNPEALKKMLV